MTIFFIMQILCGKPLRDGELQRLGQSQAPSPALANRKAAA